MRSYPIEIGLIGMGGIMRNVHLPTWIALQNEGLVRIRAICDLEPANLAMSATLFGSQVQTYDNHAELLADPTVEAVDIAVRIQDTARVTVAAAMAGKAILAEKPLGLTRSDMNEVYSAVSFHNVFYAAALCELFHPAFQELKRLVWDGELGDITHIWSNYAYRHELNFVPEEERDPNFFNWRSEIGQFKDHGHHGTYQGVALCQAEPLLITARQTNWALPMLHDDTTEAMVTLADGSELTLFSSYRERNPGAPRISVAGTAKNAWIFDTPTGSTMTIGSSHPSQRDDIEIVHFGKANHYDTEIREFVRCLVTDQQPSGTLDLAMRSLNLALAIEESARAQGQPIASVSQLRKTVYSGRV